MRAYNEGSPIRLSGAIAPFPAGDSGREDRLPCTLRLFIVLDISRYIDNQVAPEFYYTAEVLLKGFRGSVSRLWLGQALVFRHSPNLKPQDLILSPHQGVSGSISDAHSGRSMRPFSHIRTR